MAKIKKGEEVTLEVGGSFLHLKDFEGVVEEKTSFSYAGVSSYKEGNYLEKLLFDLFGKGMDKKVKTFSLAVKEDYIVSLDKSGYLERRFNSKHNIFLSCGRSSFDKVSFEINNYREGSLFRRSEGYISFKIESVNGLELKLEYEGFEPINPKD